MSFTQTQCRTEAVKTTAAVPPLLQQELFIYLFIWALSGARPRRYSGGSFLIKPQHPTGWLMCSDACLFIRGAAAGGQSDEGISLSLCCSFPYTLRIFLREGEKEKAKEDLELFLRRSKALGVIRSCLEWGQLSAVLVSPRVLSMGRIRKRVQKDWWVQCFPNEQPYTHNYTTEMNGSSWYKLRRGYANCSSNGKAAVSATQLQHSQ